MFKLLLNYITICTEGLEIFPVLYFVVCMAKSTIEKDKIRERKINGKKD